MGINGKEIQGWLSVINYRFTDRYRRKNPMGFKASKRVRVKQERGMDKTLNVILCQTADGRPLATIRNFPGLDADLFPGQLRTLAAALLAAADDCDARPVDCKYFSTVKRSYRLS